MATSLVSTGITFPDATTQTTAAVGAASGVTNTTSAVSITLTSSSNKTQNVTMTAADKAVILPAATTITKLGSDLFTINNTGAYHFYIQLSAGGYINQVAPGGSVTLSLADNTTSDGKWVQSDLGYMAYKMYDYSAFSIPNAIVVASNAAPVIAGVTAFSATTYLITYAAAGVLYGVFATLSGTSISYGTPVLISGVLNGYQGTLKYSSTTGIVIVTSSAGAAVLYPISISGSTITVGTSVSVTSMLAVIIPTGGQTLSSTLAASIFVANAGNINSVRAIQYNGASAPTVGTATTLTNFGSTNMAGIGIASATTALAIHTNGSTSVDARVVTFSGTAAPTLGTAVSLGSDINYQSMNGNIGQAYVKFMTGTEYSVSYIGNYYWQKTVTVSGTTVSSPTASAPLPQAMTSYYYLASSVSANGITYAPEWLNSTTGIVGTTGTYSTGATSYRVVETKYISGYGWLIGLNMPMPKAFYTPTGINQSNGLAGYMLTGNIDPVSAARWTVLDSSTMIATRPCISSGNAPYNTNNSIYSVLIKPTT